MPLSWNEIGHRAIAFSKEWRDETRETAERQTFWNDFFSVFGDVCVARRDFGRHLVFPLHADICVLCRRLSFDNLNPIIWHKISNAVFEANKSSKFLGKPYEPN